MKRLLVCENLKVIKPAAKVLKGFLLLYVSLQMLACAKKPFTVATNVEGAQFLNDPSVPRAKPLQSFDELLSEMSKQERYYQEEILPGSDDEAEDSLEDRSSTPIYEEADFNEAKPYILSDREFLRKFEEHQVKEASKKKQSKEPQTESQPTGSRVGGARISQPVRSAPVVLTQDILQEINKRPSIQSQTDGVCQVKNVSRAPFYGSSVTGVTEEEFAFAYKGSRKVFSSTSFHITTENFHELDKNKKTTQKISRNTLVRLLPDLFTQLGINDQQIATLLKGSSNPELATQNVQEFLAPVEVVSPENIYVRMKHQREQKNFVSKGSQGLIFSRSLVPVDQNYILMVEQDFITVGQITLRRSQLLSIDPASIQEDGSFQIKVCRIAHADGRVQELELYPFIVLKPETHYESGVQQVYLSPEYDGSLLSPLYRKHFPALAKVRYASFSLYQQPLHFADFEMDYKGFIRLPMIEDHPDLNGDITGIGFDESFVHYHGGDPDRSDTWGKGNTICAITKLANAWKKRCGDKPGCKLQIGDIAFATAARKFRNSSLDPLSHRSHEQGECVDIRPLAKNSHYGPVRINQRHYDLEKTRDFIRFAAEFGAGLIYFDDARAIQGVPVAKTNHRKFGRHDDHIHMCFYSPPSESASDARVGKNFCAP